MKDRGVIVGNNLSWNKHIQGTVSKANRVIWLLKRALGCKQLYASFVRSLLEYCPQVWGGTTKANITSLERVQRHATNYILGYPVLDYKERLSELSLLPLSYRREHPDLCFLVKCFNSEYNVDISQFITVMEGGRETRYNNNTMKLKHVLCRTEAFRRSYFNRIVYIWNLLPEDGRLCQETEQFKRIIKEFYQSLFINHFESNNTCTWRLHCNCARCNIR